MTSVPAESPDSRLPEGLRGRLKTRLLGAQQTGLIGAMVVFAVIIELSNPTFLGAGNVISLLRGSVLTFIVGTGETLVLIGGGLDLSVGSLYTAGGVAAGELMVQHVDAPLAIAFGITVGALAGLVNGAVIVYTDVPPLIATLGMQFAAIGLVDVVTNGTALYPFPGGFNALGSGSVGGIPDLVVYGIVLGIAVHLLLERTTFGYDVRAIGGNRAAAIACGVKVNKRTMQLYVLSGAIAAVGGILLASELQSAQANVGSGFELQVIVAAIIGGTSLFGGVGTIFGTALGAILIGMLNNGLIVVNVSANWQVFAIGVLVVAAVAVDRARRRRQWRR